MDNPFVPNSFQTPNNIIDKLWLYLEPNEKDLLMIAIRHILGWQENISTRTARISTSKFLRHTTLGRNTVLATLDQLHAHGILRRVGEATSKGQNWKLTIDQENAIQWDALKARLENKLAKNARKGQRIRDAGAKRATGFTVKPVSPQNRYRFHGKTSTGFTMKQSQTHRIKHTDQTQKTSSTPTGVGAPDDPTPPPSPIEHPEAFTVSAIEALQLDKAQWRLLLENEQKGLSKHGVRSSVVKHAKSKINQHPLEAHMPAMMEAVDRATVESAGHPGMAAQFRKVIFKLWEGEHPYLPDEILQFAAANPPVESVYYLPGALSRWRGKQQTKGKATHGTNGSQPPAGKQPKYPQYNRNDALERIEQRKRAAAEAAAARGDSSPGV